MRYSEILTGSSNKNGTALNFRQMGPYGSHLKEGDLITIDSEMQELSVNVSEDEMCLRRKEWIAPPLRYTRGALFKYARLVSSASIGAVTD